MKKLTVRYGLLIIILTGLGLGRVTSQATMLETQAGDYYVDAVGGSAGSPWQTITHALGQVIGPDVEIHVAAGTYDEALGESFPITMEPDVSLLGAGYTTTIISGNESDVVLHFPSTATYTETTVISGFKITGGSMGVRVDGVGGSGSSPTIRGNWIAGNNHGIYNRVASGRRVYTVVRDNIISGNSSMESTASTTRRMSMRALLRPIINWRTWISPSPGGAWGARGAVMASCSVRTRLPASVLSLSCGQITANGIFSTIRPPPVTRPLRGAHRRPSTQEPAATICASCGRETA